MMRRLAALAIALAAGGSAAPAAAQTPSPAATWKNPFCSVEATVVPWDRTSDAPASGADSYTYALLVSANATTTYAARITLIDDRNAYSVKVPEASVLRGLSGPQTSTAWMIAFDHPVSIGYYFVDGASIDGRPIADCPSSVSAIDPPGERSYFNQKLSRLPTLTARFMQTLPSLQCGKVYTPARVIRAYSPHVGHYGDRSLSTAVRIWIDSSGALVQTDVYRSSGVAGLDDAAIGAAQASTYAPAQFLCTPVVGVFLFKMQYSR